MPMSNPFMARFDRVPSLVAPEMHRVFEASLHQAANIMARLEMATEKPKMSDDFWFADDDWRAYLRPYVVKDGILQIPVRGVLLHNFPYQFGDYATGYDYVWRAFKRGMEDPNVKGIALIIDSPGGEVAGNFDLVDKMFAMRGTKPVRSYAMESAYSAAYSIASVGDTITVSRTGGVGSIGVVTSHIDISAAMEANGVRITFIHAGKHKVDGNPYEALAPDVKARIQARIDEMYGVFVSTVARNRQMDEQAIRDTEALLFTATQAVSNGLADSIGSLEDAVAAFAVDLSQEDETMAMTAEEKAAHETAVAEARAAGKSEGAIEGSTAERTRINAIIESDVGKARPVAAMAAAMGTDMSADAALAFLAKLPEEKPAAAAAPAVDPKAPKGAAGAAADFQSAMNASENPNLGAPGAGDDAGEKPSRAQAALARVKGPRKAA